MSNDALEATLGWLLTQVELCEKEVGIYGRAVARARHEGSKQSVIDRRQALVNRAERDARDFKAIRDRLKEVI